MGSNTVSASNLYGNLLGSNTVSGANLYGNLLGSNIITTSGLYGSIMGANTISASSVSANLYGNLLGSNLITTSGLYGSIMGANTIEASTLTTTSNVGIGSNLTANTLTVGSNLFVTNTGSNVLVVVGNISASFYSGNALSLTSLTGASAGTYGNSTSISQITVDATGRITGISNVSISTPGSANLAQVVNIGNVTSNTVLFTNLATSLVASGNVVANNFILNNNNIIIGIQAGQTGQNTYGVAIGTQSGQSGQGNSAVAIGTQAGQSGQGVGAVAVGEAAGQSGQGTYSIAIGSSSGGDDGGGAIAIGFQAGNSQGQGSVAIGYNTAVNQGSHAIAIDTSAGGGTSQVPNSILLNASTSNINPGAAGFYVAPIRYNGTTTSNLLSYNHSSSEIFDAGAISTSNNNITINGTSNLIGNTVASNISVFSISFGGTSNGYIHSISLQDVTDISNVTTDYITVGGLSVTSNNPVFLTSTTAFGTWSGTPTPALGGTSLAAFTATIGANITNFTPSGGLVNGSYTIYAVSNGSYTIAANVVGSVSNLAANLSLTIGNRVLINITYDGTVYYVNYVKYS